MPPCITTIPRWLRWPVLGLLFGIAGQGCGSPEVPAGPVGGAAKEQNVKLPAGAIEVGDQLYQVPIGEDDAGCRMYRLYSPSKLVAQVISYRESAGGFTTDRQKADCVTPD